MLESDFIFRLIHVQTQWTSIGPIHAHDSVLNIPRRMRPDNDSPGFHAHYSSEDHQATTSIRLALGENSDKAFHYHLEHHRGHDLEGHLDHHNSPSRRGRQECLARPLAWLQRVLQTNHTTYSHQNDIFSLYGRQYPDVCCGRSESR